MKRLALLLVIALLAAGCGEKRHHQTEAERVKMENEFSQVAMNIANGTITTGTADEATMEQFTNDYIKLTRKYADDLGNAEVKKRLTDEVSQVQPWCLQCGVLLLRERANY
jgi:PBP1b-binding outer membrane lipoprotein LpoB